MKAPNISEHFLHRLPAQMNATIGRSREIASAISLLSQDTIRLLTLTGPGGVGKTRLALEIAKGLSARFKDGIFCVSLAPLSEHSLVLATIAQVFGIAKHLVISPRTVNTHLRSIYAKLGVSSRSAATRLAMEYKLA